MKYKKLSQLYKLVQLINVQVKIVYKFTVTFGFGAAIF